MTLKDQNEERHMRFHLTLGRLALAAFLLSPAVATANTPPDCSRPSCRSQIEAMCGSLKGKPASDCAKGVVDACQSGQIVCVQPTTTTTSPPTTTTTGTTTTTTTS